MGQGEVLQVLKESRKWMTPREIAEELGVSPGSINLSLQKLYKQGEVSKRETKRPHCANVLLEWTTRK